MKKAGRRSRSPLPDAPLEFAHPFAAPAAELGDAVLAAELPAAYALLAIRTYRLVLDWARGHEEAARLHAPEALAEWEERVLNHTREEESIWAPLAVIAMELRRPVSEANPEVLARACMALAEWGVENGATGTALLWAEAAALAHPTSARYAYVASKLLRHHGGVMEAERWLQRATRIAVWNRDREVHALCLNSRGNLHLQAGRYAEAQEALEAALRVAQRAHLHERRAMVLHDLLVLAVYTGELEKAEEYGREASAAYPPGHPNRPKLTHDMAWLWAQQGQFARALLVFQALLPLFGEPDARLRINGYAARAAGAVGDHEAFRRAWDEAWTILDAGAAKHLRAAAALELGLGALNISAWEDARRALTVAREAAEEHGDNETLMKTEAAMERLWREERADQVVRPRQSRQPNPSDELARELVQALPASDQPSGPGEACVRHDA